MAGGRIIAAMSASNKVAVTAEPTGRPASHPRMLIQRCAIEYRIAKGVYLSGIGCRSKIAATMARMVRNRLLVHSIFLVLLPLVVAWFGLGIAATVALILLLMLWRWVVVLSGIVAPETTPDIVLETISASHFVEKVRWCMDRLGVEYKERQSAGALGVFFTGRSVPQLRVRTGIVQSVIGNSPDILRYLWATHHGTHEEGASFLEPTSDRLQLEKRLDRYGRNLQVWIYYHLLQDRALTLRAWGADNPLVPAWQRLTLRLLFPLLAALIRRSFSISAEHYSKSVLHIEELLAKIETHLADGRASILGGDAINYTDIAFASFSGLWMQTEGYGGGKADANRIEMEQMPAEMRADVERWLEDYPKVAAFVARLYAEERQRTEQ